MLKARELYIIGQSFHYNGIEFQVVSILSDYTIEAKNIDITQEVPTKITIDIRQDNDIVF